MLPLSPCGGLFQLTLGTAHAPEACLAAAAVVAATADLLVKALFAPQILSQMPHVCRFLPLPLPDLPPQEQLTEAAALLMFRQQSNENTKNVFIERHKTRARDLWDSGSFLARGMRYSELCHWGCTFSHFT